MHPAHARVEPRNPRDLQAGRRGFQYRGSGLFFGLSLSLNLFHARRLEKALFLPTAAEPFLRFPLREFPPPVSLPRLTPCIETVAWSKAYKAVQSTTSSGVV